MFISDIKSYRSTVTSPGSNGQNLFRFPRTMAESGFSVFGKLWEEKREGALTFFPFREE